MANSIEYRKANTAILDEVYQRSSVSGCLTSGSRMVRQGAHAKGIMIPRIEVSGLGDYVRNQGYAQGAIQFSYESHSPDYDRGLKLVADVMDVEEAGLIDCLVAAGSELQRTQVAPEGERAPSPWRRSPTGRAISSSAPSRLPCSLRCSCSRTTPRPKRHRAGHP